MIATTEIRMIILFGGNIVWIQILYRTVMPTRSLSFEAVTQHNIQDPVTEHYCDQTLTGRVSPITSHKTQVMHSTSYDVITLLAG